MIIILLLSKTDTTIQTLEEEQVTMGMVLEDVSKPININGKVFDESGNPLPYVTIIEKGTQNGSVT